MNIILKGFTDEVKIGLNHLLQVHSFIKHEQREIEITVDKILEGSTSLIISGKDGWHIYYKEPVHFFRALGILLENIENTSFKRSETTIFEGCSNMIDLSRNAVYTVEQMKRILCYLALTGHNKFYLYMEDTYELPGYPYFGYLRGRYSTQELKEIDDFAYTLGIEVIPCIQTLAHLKTTLKWNYALPMKDTADILLVGEDKTYQFIEAMFVSLKQTFRSKTIHIGMDEAMDLGSGKYLREHGYRVQYDLMTEHLARVNDLATKHGLRPLIWDDMFYRSLNKDHEYYDTTVSLTEEHIKKVPSNIGLVYWDYYHNNKEDYETLLTMRDRFPNDIIFAGGIWRWMGYVPGYTKTFATTNAALDRCKYHKVKEIMSTCWGDDGAETPIETIIPGLILFGEHCYGQDTSMEAVSSKCEFLTGVSLFDFMKIEKIDIIPGCEAQNIKTRNPSKHILFQDLLLGAFDTYFDREGLEEHYAEVKEELHTISKTAGKFEQLFVMYAKLAAVLEKKVKLGIKIRNAYQSGDKDTLKTICEQIFPVLKEDVENFKKEYAKIWFRESKGHGFEVIDIRLGGLMSRIETVKYRLEDYIKGDILIIEELEETILPYELGGYPEGPYLAYNKYRDIVTQNLLSHY